jgi:predicted nucleic acid binding AN1-type Zn finger protein
MPKRNLRIVKRVKNVPVIGICEYCKVQFQAEHQPAGQQARAQAVIQQQFNAHKCEPQEASRVAIVPKNLKE